MGFLFEETMKIKQIELLWKFILLAEAECDKYSETTSINFALREGFF